MRKTPVKFIIFTAIILIGLMVIIYANSMTGGNDSPYNVEVSVIKGWNLIAGIYPAGGAILKDSEIKASDIKAIWYYAPTLKKYIQIHPNLDSDTMGTLEDDVVLTSAMWVYSDKAGVLKYSTIEDYMPLSFRKFYAGWNLVTVVPLMIEKNINEFKGTCDILKAKAYGYDNSGTTFYWNDLLDEKLPIESVGIGMAIEISKDCTFGEINVSEETISPPSIPS